ncbi:serine/threonine-protein kinase 17B-like [Linepithema humile]|uniref:serine/threonine-protein kinase 17B-like n=1 Tax=Linepithema humile TaxID=83485 RepID=UPI000623770E|nr:PREDICTED: serine/threonine-protein kinase 17B-like isoform X1 [Linepithema humile]XP_012223286.1 PREDICTED: serine/threonine-protein kinase 17B-like isoform X2 [Linepithema humile]
MTADSLFETTSIPGHLAPTPERLERLLSKQTLEELYEVEEQPFARGKYATVRRCRERSSGRQWAAKFLRKRRRAQELRAEALHEVAVLDAAAHCSRLVSLHQVFETNTEMVLVLEMAPGGELQMILDRDEVPEERQVARLLKQILDGIAFLHSLNVAHLDIKPQNLVLTGEFPDCDVKLCDFGISRYISHGADIREILGTPDYVAPEVLNYEPISLATDMWSVGVLLYVLLTGCSPFGGDTKQETFCNISRCRLDFPDDLFEDVSEEARDLMRKLMVKDPCDRLTVTECLQHPWFSIFEQASSTPLPSTTCSASDNSPVTDSTTTSTQEEASPSKQPIANGQIANTSSPTSKSDSEKQQQRSSTSLCHSPESSKPTSPRAVSSHTENLYTSAKSTPKPIRFGLSPDRRDTFKRNMDSLARKFSGTVLPEIVIIESTSSASSSGNGGIQQRRATATHTMPAGGEVFKCTPVFILGEAEQQCSDSGSDTVSEISTDSSSDRSSIYSDDSLDFILYGKSQGRASFPFTAADAAADRWDHRHHRTAQVWPRECSGVVSKALSRFTSESGASGTTKMAKMPTSMATATALRSASKIGLEALRERGGNLVVIREPVRAGRYTRYSEVQCESVQARIRRFQVHEAS